MSLLAALTLEGKTFVTKSTSVNMPGDFTQEAYEALRESYAAQLQTNAEIELAGTEVMGQKLTVETLPVDSPWRDKIDQWTYPTGKSAYTDGPQRTPEEVLEVMRAAAAEKAEANAESDKANAEQEQVEAELQGMSDEEFDQFVDDLLSEDTDIEIIEEALAELADDEVDDEVDDEEDEEEDYEDEAEEEVEKESYPDAETIAEEIAALRADLEGLAFNNEE